MSTRRRGQKPGHKKNSPLKKTIGDTLLFRAEDIAEIRGFERAGPGSGENMPKLYLVFHLFRKICMVNNGASRPAKADPSAAAGETAGFGPLRPHKLRQAVAGLNLFMIYCFHEVIQWPFTRSFTCS
jgi:hypothetical protein